MLDYVLRVMGLRVTAAFTSLSPNRRLIAPRRCHPPPARDQGLRLRLRLQRLPSERQRNGIGRLLRHARRLLARDQSAGAGRRATRDLLGEAITQRWLVNLLTYAASLVDICPLCKYSYPLLVSMCNIEYVIS